MVWPKNQLPYGLRALKLTPYNADGISLGTPVTLPVSRTLSWRESEDFNELTGDDALVALHGSGPAVTWSLEAGGIDLSAFAVLAGGTNSASGVTPNQINTLAKVATDTSPYFKCE